MPVSIRSFNLKQQMNKRYTASVLKNIFDFSRLKFSTFAVLALWTPISYLIPNKIILFDPILVPRTLIDHWVPLASHWVWVYVSFYFFIFGTYLLLKTEFVRKTMFYSFLAATTVSSFIFFFLPTMIERGLYPLKSIDHASDWLLSLIRLTDTSVNCLPSMHVALSMISAFAIAAEFKKFKYFGFFWFLMICYSTMATKQHYFYDVLAGSIYGFIFWVFFYFLFQKEKMTRL